MVMFDRVLRWREETVSQYRVGQVQAKFINEASNALGGAAATLTTIIRESAQVVGLIAVLFWHNWQLSIVTFLIAPMLALVLRWTNKKIKGFTHRLQKMFGVLVGNIQEAYLGERVVKIYGGHEYEVERFADVNEQLRELNLKSQQVNAASTPLTQLITMAGVAVVVVVALLQAQAGELTIGEFTTFLAALLLLQSPIKRLSSLNGTTAAMTAAAESLFTFIDMPVEEDPGDKELPHPVKGEVVFKDVCLQYPTAKKMALKNFNLTVKPGEVIALVGSSGSGKTSVINLLPHFWTATSGDITIDGVSINEVTLSSLRKNMALVSQDVVIFDGRQSARPRRDHRSRNLGGHRGRRGRLRRGRWHGRHRERHGPLPEVTQPRRARRRRRTRPQPDPLGRQARSARHPGHRRELHPEELRRLGRRRSGEDHRRGRLRVPEPEQ